jgi:pimeloyl-ACP methyl ester carboxylesterase
MSSMIRRSRGRFCARLLALTFVSIALVPALASAKAATSTGLPKAPAGLAFYSPPARLLAGPHGSVIWARPAQPGLRLAGAARQYVVLYRSTSLQGRPIAVSGTVWIPRGKAPKGGWKVISWAHGTTGSADSCAPSRDSAGDPAHSYIAYVYPEFTSWLRAGYVVAQTDYQGLGTGGPHPYLIGHAEGRGVNDIVRAARRLDPMIGKRFAIAGHSQGGQAALFAAADASKWVPELKLVGVAAFAPASHISTQIKAAASLTTPSGVSALGALILTGAAAGSPAVKLPQILSPQALALVPQVDTKCLGQLSQTDSWGGLAPAALFKSGADQNPLLAVTDGENPALRIGPPVLLLQGDADQTVFKVFTDQLSTELTGLGDKLDYRVFPGITHGAIVAAGASATSTWLGQRFGR